MLRTKPIPEGRQCNHPTCQGSTCRRPQEARRERKPIPAYKYKPKENAASLDAFFLDCYKIIAAHPYCSECNTWIEPNMYRFATAHIFPKSLFPSIATHPLNWLKLHSICGCHDRSHRLDTFSKMMCFRFAVERFVQFEHLIIESHKYLSEFKNYAIKENLYAKP